MNQDGFGKLEGWPLIIVVIQSYNLAWLHQLGLQPSALGLGQILTHCDSYFLKPAYEIHLIWNLRHSTRRNCQIKIYIIELSFFMHKQCFIGIQVTSDQASLQHIWSVDHTRFCARQSQQMCNYSFFFFMINYFYYSLHKLMARMHFLLYSNFWQKSSW